MDSQKVEPLRRRLVFLEQVELFISDAFNPDISSCIMEESHQIDQRLVIKLGFTLSLGLCQVLFQACTPLLLFLSANLYFIS